MRHFQFTYDSVVFNYKYMTLYQILIIPTNNNAVRLNYYYFQRQLDKNYIGKTLLIIKLRNYRIIFAIRYGSNKINITETYSVFQLSSMNKYFKF